MANEWIVAEACVDTATADSVKPCGFDALKGFTADSGFWDFEGFMDK